MSTIAADAKRLPAYARPLAEARRQGLRPASNTVKVFLDFWPPRNRPAHVWIPSVVIPVDADPQALLWSFLEGLDAILLVRQELSAPERVRSALRAILMGNPTRLVVLADGRMWFAKSAADGIEVDL
jgi:hypothetical protein